MGRKYVGKSRMSLQEAWDSMVMERGVMVRGKRVYGAAALAVAIKRARGSKKRRYQ